MRKEQKDEKRDEKKEGKEIPPNRRECKLNCVKLQ